MKWIRAKHVEEQAPSALLFKTRAIVLINSSVKVFDILNRCFEKSKSAKIYKV